MDRFCRGCLVRYEETTELIQYTEKNRRLFVYCTGIQVKRTDAFTFQLCRSCYMNMKVACKFKKQCRNSDKLFKTYQGLRDNEDHVDLSTFLKNNDDSWTFRFPGNSTPAYQRTRDDDNESTTTSIRNFMNDMMPDEFPDTEARIIREVIDEAADVLDDSLDSHWLQDDASIDSDFRLDFSFSPFSTPRPVNNDRYTPKKQTVVETGNNKEKPKQISPRKVLDSLNLSKILDPPESPKVLDNLDMPLIDEESNLASTVAVKVERFFDDALDARTPTVALEEERHSDETTDARMPPATVKVERHFDETMDSLDVVNDFLNRESENTNRIESDPASQCTIVRNLEEALKNTDNKEFLLDELLVSPKAIPDIKSPATPFINNILFGKKLDLDENSHSSPRYKLGQCIETFQNVAGDVEMTEFTGTIEKLEDIDLEELKTEIIDEIDKHAQLDGDNHENQEKENQYNITNFYCNMCQKKFKSLKGLQRHSKMYHQHKIKPRRVFMCDYCGEEYNDRTNFVRHVERKHLRPPAPKLICDVCKMEFQTQNTLKQHKRSHTGQERAPSHTHKKKFLCLECGATTDKASNHALHMKRHTKTHSHACPECNKGFYRQSELTLHMRYHTGEKPYACPNCDMRFVRRDSLTRHVKMHLDLKPFKCDYCKSRFINNSSLKNHLKKSKKCLKDRMILAKNQQKIEENRAEKSIVTEEIVKGTRQTILGN